MSNFVDLVSVLLKRYIAYLSSTSKKSGINTSPLKKLLRDNLSNYTANVSSYVTACQEDPELKSFDSSLQLRTSKLICSLAAGVGKTENFHLDSLTEICKFLLVLSEEVVKAIISCNEDASKDEELKSLVDLYYESTTKTLALFNTVEECVKKAEIIQLIIRVAIKQFEKESMDTDLGGNNKKYKDTLEELNKVKAMRDPFGGEFMEQFASVYGEHHRLFEKFRELQVKLDKKQKNVKNGRRLTTILFAAAFFSVIVLSVFLCTVVAPPTVAAVSTGLAAATGSAVATGAAGIWVNEMMKGYEKAFKTQKGLFLLTENNAKVNIEAMKTIQNLVETLRMSISAILETVEVGVQTREEEAMKLVMQEIIKKVDGFAEKIEEVGEHVAKCSKLVTSGKVRVMEHINSSASL